MVERAPIPMAAFVAFLDHRVMVLSCEDLYNASSSASIFLPTITPPRKNTVWDAMSIATGFFIITSLMAVDYSTTS